MAFCNDQQTSSSLDTEIRTLCRNAIDQPKKVDTNSNRQKKQIITELARRLEEKVIPINTICIEIVNQLRGFVSESFVRKCLDQKYKDPRRSQNAKQQNKVHLTKPKTDPKSKLDSLKKIDKEYPEAIISDNSDDIDDLALLGTLDQEIVKEEEEDQLQEIVAIADANGSQMLIRRDENNRFDEDIHGDTKYRDLDSKIPLTEKNNQTTTDLLCEPIQQILPSKCSDCERKDILIHLKNITIEELEQAIEKSTQLVSADKLADKVSMVRIEESTKQKIPFNMDIPFEDLRRDMASNNRSIASNMSIVFSGYVNQDTGKVINPSWKITTK